MLGLEKAPAQVLGMFINDDSETKMFAIVEACGRQYKLEPGRFIDIDRTDVEKGAEHVFDKVLMLVDGDKSTVGQPYVDGATVKGKIISSLDKNEETGKTVSSVRNKKVIVYNDNILVNQSSIIP